LQRIKRRNSDKLIQPLFWWKRYFFFTAVNHWERTSGLKKGNFAHYWWRIQWRRPEKYCQETSQ